MGYVTEKRLTIIFVFRWTVTMPAMCAKDPKGFSKPLGSGQFLCNPTFPPSDGQASPNGLFLVHYPLIPSH